jgi:transposase
MPPETEQQLRDQIVSLHAKVAELSALNEQLRQAVDTLSRRIFGKSSEKLDPNQLEFLLGALARPATPPPSAAPADLQPPARANRTNKKRASRIPQNLPVTEEIIDPPAVIANPDGFRRIGEEVTQRVAFTPGKFRVIRQIRGKYVAIGNPAAKPIIAPLPPCLLERGTADASFVAEIIYNRFGLHLPYYRQAEMFATLGVRFDRKTLCEHAMLGAEWLAIIYREIQAEHWRSRYRQFDETPVDYLKPGSGKAQKGYFWVSNIPGGSVFFHWRTGRGAEGAAELFGEAPNLPEATLTEKEIAELVYLIQCDGYSAYPSWASKRPWIKLPGCNAHARRKFIEAMEQAPGLVGWIIRQYAALYQIEARLRESKAGPALRAAVRASESRMIFERLKRVIGRIGLRKSILPKSKLGKAIHYALAQWVHLELFLTHGQVEIDNNLVENAIRPTKLGAKNWLFIGREEAGQSAAVLYTIMVNCRRLDIDPREYLVDVLTRLPAMQASEAAALTPAAWQAARQGKTLRQVA